MKTLIMFVGVLVSFNGYAKPLVCTSITKDILEKIPHTTLGDYFCTNKMEDIRRLRAETLSYLPLLTVRLPDSAKLKDYDHGKCRVVLDSEVYVINSECSGLVSKEVDND